MDTLIKLNNQTAGRDKLARLFQYTSRILWHHLQTRNKDAASGIKNLEYQLSTFRKLLRFGRFIDVLHSTLPLFKYPDPTIRFTVILSKICNALFLLADHILWLGRSDLMNVETNKWSTISNKYWLYSIVMNLLRDFHEISIILKMQKHKILPNSCSHSLRYYFMLCGNLLTLFQYNKGVVIDTVKNVCDFFIPFTALGYVKLTPGTVGWLGTVSSLMGLIVLVEPLAKLSPS